MYRRLVGGSGGRASSPGKEQQLQSMLEDLSCQSL